MPGIHLKCYFYHNKKRNYPSESQKYFNRHQ